MKLTETFRAYRRSGRPLSLVCSRRSRDFRSLPPPLRAAIHALRPYCYWTSWFERLPTFVAELCGMFSPSASRKHQKLKGVTITDDLATNPANIRAVIGLRICRGVGFVCSILCFSTLSLVVVQSSKCWSLRFRARVSTTGYRTIKHCRRFEERSISIDICGRSYPPTGYPLSTYLSYQNTVAMVMTVKKFLSFPTKKTNAVQFTPEKSTNYLIKVELPVDLAVL